MKPLFVSYHQIRVMKSLNYNWYYIKNAFVGILVLLNLNCKEPENERPKTKDAVSTELEISSSNKELVGAFNWAVKKAYTFVQTNKRGPINISEQNTQSEEVAYIPSYWAGYPGRSAFYSRDYCHQLIGAHLLGLEEENFAMMKAFATSADANKRWFPLWAINFDGSPFELDYRGDDNFVREVPAVFELVEKAYDLFQWTGDNRYILDEDLWKYYTKAVTDFVSLHDRKIPNGVAEGTGKGIFDGAASYNEQHDYPLIEAGDAISSQYKAFYAFSNMAALRGEIVLARQFDHKTSDLKAYFNNDWGTKGTESYNRGYLQNGDPVAGWGKENSWFMPMKGIVDAGTQRTNDYLDYINERLETKEDMPNNIEALSYIPEVFFLHHKNELGWKWMKYIISQLQQGHVTSDLTGRNGDYPEVSYVLIKNIVEDLLGIVPKANENMVSTLSHLPDEIKYLEVANIKIGKKSIQVKHDGINTTVFNFQAGEGSLLWQARMPGSHDFLFVDGIKKPCKQDEDHGLKYSYYNIELKEGESSVVSVKP